MIYRVIFLLVLAPIGAAVVVAALLLFGAKPALVFFAGHAVRNGLRAAGVETPNAVGVICTVMFYWAIIAAIGLAWERRRRKQPVL